MHSKLKLTGLQFVKLKIDLVPGHPLPKALMGRNLTNYRVEIVLNRKFKYSETALPLVDKMYIYYRLQITYTGITDYFTALLT